MTKPKDDAWTTCRRVSLAVALLVIGAGAGGKGMECVMHREQQDCAIVRVDEAVNGLSSNVLVTASQIGVLIPQVATLTNQMGKLIRSFGLDQYEFCDTGG